MKKILKICLCLICIIGGIIMSHANNNIFTLSSLELKHNDILPNSQVYNGYGCNGGNVSPQLSWENAPKNTKSFAIVCHDPDAPRPNGWYHWIVVDIPANVKSVKQGEKIIGAKETKTDFETVGFGGACPPKGHGIHHYNFTIYALNVEKMDIDENINPFDAHKKIMSHTIAKSTITGLYER